MVLVGIVYYVGAILTRLSSLCRNWMVKSIHEPSEYSAFAVESCIMHSFDST